MVYRPSDASTRKLRVFLCHASEDKPAVRDIYQQLQQYNIEPWLDEKNLLPGEHWEMVIPDVISKCDIVLICLSRTFLSKESYGNQEIHIVLKASKNRSPDSIYHIPFRLDDCEVPSYLAEVHYASNFVPGDFAKLIAACEKRREWLNQAGQKIEPLTQQVSKNAPYSYTYTPPARAVSEQTRPQTGNLHGNSSPNSVASAQNSSDQSITVEHFTKTISRNSVNVFLSYAYEDAWFLQQLENHLSGLKREGLISTWCDRQIMSGAHWAGVIDQHLELASLILFLVSADFLASDYCYQIELARALELHKAGTATVIPIILRPTDWQKTPLADLKALPGNNQAITDWENADHAFVKIVTGIRKVVDELILKSPSPNYSPASKSQPSVSPPKETPKPEGVSCPPLLKPPIAQPLSQPQPVLNVYRPGVVPAAPTARESFVEKSGPVTPPPIQRQSDAERPRIEVTSQPGPALPSRLSTSHPAPRFGDPFPKIWNVPRRHSAFFTGRIPVLDHILDTFRLENEAGMISTQALTGLGGMGKTQVAAEYAYRFRADYQAVLWVRADTLENLLADFKTIAGLLKLPPHLLRNQKSLMRTMQDWFMSQSDWVLIFDNADNPVLVDPFLPRAARGHILATTRAGAVVEWAPQSLNLEKLGTDDGALCILRRAGQLKEQQQLLDASPARVEVARKLASMMGGLPMAMEQAGAYINDTDCGVSKYLKLYEKYRPEIQRRLQGVLHEYPESVVSAWAMSRSMVAQSNPAAAELLCLCAFLAPEGIPDELILDGAPHLGPVLGPVAENELLFNQTISVLRKYSLIHREVNGETDLTTLSIHRIMQEILIDEMDQGTQRIWAERAVRAVEQTLRSEPDPWPLLQAHARKCRKLIAQWQMNFREANNLLKLIDHFERQ